MRKPQMPATDENGAMNADAASVAIAALSWIAADGEMMSRFCALSGIEPVQIRQAATEPGFLAGVLDFLLAHEPTLMRFCDDNGLDPARVQETGLRLSGGAVPGPGDVL